MNESRIDQLKFFLEKNPDDSFVKYALAIEHIKLGDDETALQFFHSILKNDPDYTATYYHLGKLFERRRAPKEAAAAYRAGLSRTLGKEPRAHAELQQALDELLFDSE